MTAPTSPTPAGGAASPTATTPSQQRHVPGGLPTPHPEGEAPHTGPTGAVRSFRIPSGATARRAIDRGEFVICTEAGEPVTRTSDPADAERLRAALNGRIKRRLVVTP